MRLRSPAPDTFDPQAFNNILHAHTKFEKSNLSNTGYMFGRVRSRLKDQKDDGGVSVLKR